MPLVCLPTIYEIVSSANARIGFLGNTAPDVAMDTAAKNAKQE
jgi:hypothetical protein